MNGEIEQMSSIVCCARKALYDNKDIEYTPGKYVLSTKFVFSSPFAVCETTETDSVQKWFCICKKRGLCDIKFIVPTATNQRHLLGFANTSRGAIVSFWENGEASYFSPAWQFDNDRRGWNVIYRQQSGITVPKGEFPCLNKSEEFKSVLMDISAFDEKIGNTGFSDYFRKAYNGLCDSAKVDEDRVPKHIPKEFKGLYYAADVADVFGGMGSWNDSPACYAEEMGLKKEYDRLSDRLLKQLRYHLMYVTNECWKRN